MRVATWNVERLKHKNQLEQILFACNNAKADILVLTETDEIIHPDFKYGVHTPYLTGEQPVVYKPTENRVSIFTNYPCIRQYDTYDKNTALCVELETPKGNLLIYGTIIGILGNRHPSFQQDLQQQTEDIKRFSAEYELCVCGDFNCTFADNYYFTRQGRETMLNAFSESNMRILTADQPECIDHIVISESFLSEYDAVVTEWNLDKAISDHKGIVVEF